MSLNKQTNKQIMFHLFHSDSEAKMTMSFKLFTIFHIHTHTKAPIFQFLCGSAKKK